jgi:hypothetical protein
LATEEAEIATLYEFHENYRFSTAYCDPYMGHTLRLFYTFHHKKGHKGLLLRKMPKVRIKLDKMLKD